MSTFFLHRRAITLVGMGLFTTIAWVVRNVFFSDVTGYHSYSCITLCWIATAATLVLAVDWIWFNRKPAPSNGARFDNPGWFNRRRFYRLVYGDESEFPVVEVHSTDDHPRRKLTYRICDLSENGICFLDDGSFGPVSRVSGLIRWSDGANEPLLGTVMRYQDLKISVQLEWKLNAGTVYLEQQRLIRRYRTKTTHP